MYKRQILDRGKEYGLTVVWLDSMRKKLPNTCKMVLEINGGFTGRYEIERHSQKKEKINFDYTEKNIAEKLIRSISGIKVMERSNNVERKSMQRMQNKNKRRQTG